MLDGLHELSVSRDCGRARRSFGTRQIVGSEFEKYTECQEALTFSVGAEYGLKINLEPTEKGERRTMSSAITRGSPIRFALQSL